MMKSVSILFLALIAAAPAFAQESGWIGVSIADQTDRGVLVRSVETNSPAEKAGLKANDIILQFNKQEVAGALQLTRLVNETPVGRTVDVTIRRDNREQTLKVTTGRAPFGISALHIHPPDLSHLRDQINFAVTPRVQVLTSISTSQVGIRTDSLTPQLRDFFGVKGGNGVLVASVEENSVAAKA